MNREELELIVTSILHDFETQVLQMLRAVYRELHSHLTDVQYGALTGLPFHDFSFFRHSF